MTDDEIIKALECCGNIVDSTCKECAYHETYNASCVVRLMRNALDLINRQKAEILELQKRIINWRTDMDYRPDEIKSEAIKEFAERLKEKLQWDVEFDNKLVFESDIDNLVKEMTEVETNQRKEDEGK